jgi:phenylpyruvate tautomerase PptA (4-oxalocrotonate tautomerase family)
MPIIDIELVSGTQAPAAPGIAQVLADVTIIASAPPTGEVLRRRVAQITEIVARHTHRPPELVHVLFEPLAPGRIAFGGRLVE